MGFSILFFISQNPSNRVVFRNEMKKNCIEQDFARKLLAWLAGKAGFSIHFCYRKNTQNDVIFLYRNSRYFRFFYT